MRGPSHERSNRPAGASRPRTSTRRSFADAVPRGPAPKNFDASKFCRATRARTLKATLRRADQPALRRFKGQENQPGGPHGNPAIKKPQRMGLFHSRAFLRIDRKTDLDLVNQG